MSAALHFLASRRPDAEAIVHKLIDRYGQTDLAQASCLVAVGGDGTTLKALQTVLPTRHVPVFAMRIAGSVGALGNRLLLDGLTRRLNSAREYRLTPLILQAKSTGGVITSGLGFNEVVIVRDRLQAVRLRLSPGLSQQPIDLFGDGLVIATALGSTGYCRSLGGAQIPIGSRLLSLVGIALRTPAAGLSTVVKDDALIGVEVVEPHYRPVRVETHTTTLEDVASLEVKLSPDHCVTLLRDPDEPFPELGVEAPAF